MNATTQEAPVYTLPTKSSLNTVCETLRRAPHLYFVGVSFELRRELLTFISAEAYDTLACLNLDSGNTASDLVLPKARREIVLSEGDTDLLDAFDHDPEIIGLALASDGEVTGYVLLSDVFDCLMDATRILSKPGKKAEIDSAYKKAQYSHNRIDIQRVFEEETSALT